MLSVFLATSSFATAQVRINEVMAQNNSTVSDPDYGNSADWVELYNSGTASVDLSGYSFTDDFSTPTKFTIPQGTSISAGGYLILWCDGNATGLHTSFKLSADGEQIGLYNQKGEVIDSLTFGPQLLDISYGRMLEEADTWAFFSSATPGKANNTTAYDGKSNQPMILTRGGLYSGSVTVSITNDLGGLVHYTTDGSQPTETSPIYTEPLTFDKTTVLRARIIEAGKMPGMVLTESYFIDEAFAGHELPVVSIVTENDNFWGAQNGIYTQSFKPDWEIPVNIEMFLNNGSDRSAFNEAAGIKINGLNSWMLPQKMLGVYFKKKYGESKLAYQLFYDDDRSAFDDFALRASGNDWSYTLMRDGLVQQASRKGEMNLDLMAFRPCVVYVNGEFLGIHNMREKVDEDYITQHYGYKGSEFDMVESETPAAEVGTTETWTNFKNFFTNTDMSIESNYNTLAETMDVENFTDYMIAESYSGNTSLDHNTMVWKPRVGGKWRWVLMDTDRGFFVYDSNVIDYIVKRTYWPLSKMLANNNYKQYFTKRLADQLFTTYNAEEICRQIDGHEKDIEPQMAKQVARWLGTTSSYGNAMPSVEFWHNQVDALRDFAHGRISILLNDLTKYGTQKPALLSLSAQPAEACTWDFNGHKTSRSDWYGLYPKQMNISLTANHRAGYNFEGWKQTTITDAIARGSQWQYLDNGTDQGTQWVATNFDDTAWKSGLAPLGYGFSNIKTTVSYGSSSSNKYLTTYFRKHFNIVDAKNIRGVKIQLLREDGAVVYLNGERVINSNMPLQGVNYRTKSSQALNQLAGINYIVFDLDPSLLKEGDNVFAVEVHQTGITSSDLSFDLQLQLETLPADAPLLSTESTLNFQMQQDMGVCAVYEKTSLNVLPDTIHSDMTLYKSQSPYYATGDVLVKNGARLTIEPGVTLLFSPKANIYVHGAITAEGNANDSIMFKLNPEYNDSLSWGAMCFINTGDQVSSMSYAELRDASNGPAEYYCVAAISGFKTILKLDHMRLVDNDANPVACRYSDLHLTNSVMYSRITGDLTNVKYGKGYIADCEYIGNDKFDTDAVDFDGVTNGVIRRIAIHHMLGSNSDAIDIGEQAQNIQIDSVLVYDVTDKGLSVGQRSTVKITNSTIIQTTLGVGVKDSCTLVVDHCTFYAVQTPIACYEKVLGRAGGNAIVTSCLFANSFVQDVLCDDKSTVKIDNSLSDEGNLPYGEGNVTADPDFAAPAIYDLTTTAVATENKGSHYLPEKPNVQPTITKLCYLPDEIQGETEFVAIYNPGVKDIDLTGYSFNNGVTYTFPAGLILPANDYIYVARDIAKIEDGKEVFKWDSGRLADEGESIELMTPDGIIVDQVRYSPVAPWPVITDYKYNVIAIKDILKANNLPSNWQLLPATNINSIEKDNTSANKYYDIQGRSVNPNSTNGLIIINGKKILKR